MRKLFFPLLILIALFIVNCSFMPPILQPAKPYCTVDEQADSIIYKYLNPADAKFFLMLGMAKEVEDHPGRAEGYREKLEALKIAVEAGITYSAFEVYIGQHFGPITGVVISEAMQGFKGVEIPLKVCDKRLCIGAIDKLLSVVAMAKVEYILFAPALA